MDGADARVASVLQRAQDALTAPASAGPGVVMDLVAALMESLDSSKKRADQTFDTLSAWQEKLHRREQAADRREAELTQRQQSFDAREALLQTSVAGDAEQVPPEGNTAGADAEESNLAGSLNDEHRASRASTAKLEASCCIPEVLTIALSSPVPIPLHMRRSGSGVHHPTTAATTVNVPRSGSDAQSAPQAAAAARQPARVSADPLGLRGIVVREMRTSSPFKRSRSEKAQRASPGGSRAQGALLSGGPGKSVSSKSLHKAHLGGSASPASGRTQSFRGKRPASGRHRSATAAPASPMTPAVRSPSGKKRPTPRVLPESPTGSGTQGGV